MQNGHLPGEGASKDREGQPRGLCGPPVATLLTSLPSGRPPQPEAWPAPCPAQPCRLRRDEEDPLRLWLPTEPSLGLARGSPGCKSGRQPSGRGAETVPGPDKLLLPSVLPTPPLGALPAPHWTQPRSKPHDLPSRWEQHKESTFHAPHQAHAERLRVLKNSL